MDKVRSAYKRLCDLFKELPLDSAHRELLRKRELDRIKVYLTRELNKRGNNYSTNEKLELYHKIDDLFDKWDRE